jgi:hypothetical protein
VTSALRVFFVGGRISYRALFNWISPTMYTTTMLVGPFFQVLFFVYLGRYAGNESDAFFIVGNSIQVCGLAGIFGMIMGIANERQFGTSRRCSRHLRTGSRCFSAAACPRS